MKTIFTYLFLLILSIGANAQDNYYWYKTEKIILKKNSSANYYITDKLNNSEKSNFIQQAKLNGAKVIGMSAHELIVEGKETTGMKSMMSKNLYRATTYISENGSPVIIRPTIMLRLAEKRSVKEILDKYREKLVLKVEKGYDTYVFDCTVETGDEVLRLANELKENYQYVIWCEPDMYGGYNKSTSDPMFSEQYYLKNTGQFGGSYGMDINMELAWWYFPKGSSTLRVAVIDAGVEAHDDLGTILPGYTAGSTTGTGAPQNGQKAHGMACAGIIAAQHNTIGIAGIAPNVQILPINIFPNIEVPGWNPAGVATNAEITTAIDWAWNEGQADVLSNSWGGPNPSSAVEDAINRARTLGRNSCGLAKGSVVVVASGNEHPTWNFVQFPASLSGVVAVGAVNRNGAIQGYSNRGPELDLVAPSGMTNWAGDVRTLDRMGAAGQNNGDYMNVFGGTSAACPQVSGVAALMLSVNPHLTEAQVRSMLNSTAIDMGSSGFDNTFGHGRVNAYHALIAASNAMISGPSLICYGETYTIPNLPTGASVTWSVTGDISISGPSNGTSVYVVKTGNGKGNIEAVISSSCSPSTSYTFTKNNIIIGSPLPADGGVFIDNNGQVPLDQTAYFTSSQTVYISLSNPAYSYYIWSDFYKNGDVIWYHQAGTDGLVIMFQNPQYGDYVGMSLGASNSCGINNSPLFIYYTGGPYYYYKAFPNPSNSLVTIAPITKANKLDELPTEIVQKIPKMQAIARFAIFDKMGSNVLNNSVSNKSGEIQIDIRNLRSDVYSLVLYLENGKSETHKIVKSD